MRPSFVCEPNRHPVFRVYRFSHTDSLTKDFPSLALERFTKSVAERQPSAAAESRSGAEAGGSQLQGVAACRWGHRTCSVRSQAWSASDRVRVTVPLKSCVVVSTPWGPAHAL